MLKDPFRNVILAFYTLFYLRIMRKKPAAIYQTYIQ